jgi:hypothetical protein
LVEQQRLAAAIAEGGNLSPLLTALQERKVERERLENEGSASEAVAGTLRAV